MSLENQNVWAGDTTQQAGAMRIFNAAMREHEPRLHLQRLMVVYLVPLQCLRVCLLGHLETVPGGMWAPGHGAQFGALHHGREKDAIVLGSRPLAL